MRKQINNALFFSFGILLGAIATSIVYQKQHTALTLKVKHDTIYEYCT